MNKPTISLPGFEQRSKAFILALILVVLTNVAGFFLPKLQSAPYQTTLLESPPAYVCPGDTVPLKLKFEVLRPGIITFFTTWRDVTVSKNIVTDTVGITLGYDRAGVSFVDGSMYIPNAPAGHLLRMIRSGRANGAEDFIWSLDTTVSSDCVAKTGDK